MTFGMVDIYGKSLFSNEQQQVIPFKNKIEVIKERPILREYQERGITELAQKLASGVRKVIFQLATGGGKTMCFSAIAERYIAKSPKSVLIMVHRKELLKQTRKTLFDAFGISSQVIVAGMKRVPLAPVYVSMVESTAKRLPPNIGLVVIDEAHEAAFHKMHQYFPDQFIIGVTATPISANKKKPLRNYYDDIICGVDIRDLIQMKFLAQNITYAPRDTVLRSNLTMRGNDFDEEVMAREFSKPRYINYTLNEYRKRADGTKAIIYNVNVDHSIQVMNAFKVAGYECKHVDGTTPDIERANIFKWFNDTAGAILCNVGIATTGTDIPSIETVIYNKSTKSIINWLQCCGRGGRITPFKSAFTIIDMGNNAMEHGDWCDPRDWRDIFFNPPTARASRVKVAPVKSCPECEAILQAGVRICPYCDYHFPVKEAALEEELSDFVVITRNINVAEVINNNKHLKAYYAFYKIGTDLADGAKQTIPEMTDEVAKFTLMKYLELASEWCDSVRKNLDEWHMNRAKEHLYKELQTRFKKWKPQQVAA